MKGEKKKREKNCLINGAQMMLVTVEDQNFIRKPIP